MPVEIFWINEIEPIRLAIMPRPRQQAGDWLRDTVRDWQSQNIGMVVSLLESHEMWEFGLSEENNLCIEHGIEFLSFPIRDRDVPKSFSETKLLIDRLALQLRAGVGIAIHCRAGIGRSGLIAGCVLVKLGVPFADVFPMIIRARDLKVPDTAAQAEWVKTLFLEKSS